MRLSSLMYVQLAAGDALLPALCDTVLGPRTMGDLIDAALEDDCWPEPTARYSILHWRGRVQVSSEEVTELGIPYKSLRGWSGLGESRYEWVDRRCLKRYRRKAGRRV